MAATLGSNIAEADGEEDADADGEETAWRSLAELPRRLDTLVRTCRPDVEAAAAIAAGRVTVDGEQPAAGAKQLVLGCDGIRLDGEPLRHERGAGDFAVYAFHKPRGMACDRSVGAPRGLGGVTEAFGHAGPLARRITSYRMASHHITSYGMTWQRMAPDHTNHLTAPHRLNPRRSAAVPAADVMMFIVHTAVEAVCALAVDPQHHTTLHHTTRLHITPHPVCTTAPHRIPLYHTAPLLATSHQPTQARGRSTRWDSSTRTRLVRPLLFYSYCRVSYSRIIV